MDQPPIFRRQDWLISFVLVILAFALRVPFKSHYAYHWDGAQFALAVEQYDLSSGQPHAPGFFLYVWMGRIARFFSQDAHAGLVWISVFSGSLLVSLGFLLGTALGGRQVGNITAGILMTSPLCWFHSEIALTSIVDATLVTATVLACWIVRLRNGDWIGLALMSILYSLVAGNRPQTAPILLPVWLYTFLGLTSYRWRKLIVAISFMICVSLLWFCPLIQNAGGLKQYVQLLSLKSHFDASKTYLGAGIKAVTQSSIVITSSCWAGLNLAAILGVSGYLRRLIQKIGFRRSDPYPVVINRGAILFLVIWIVPMVLFGLFMYTTMPGYVLSYFPALAVLSAIGIILSRRVIKPMVSLGLVIIVNLLLFVFPLAKSTAVLASVKVTGHHIKEHDLQLESAIATVRAQFDPNDVIIYHCNQFFYFGFRHFQYHLPEYRNILLSHDASLPGARSKKMWYGKDRKTEFIDGFQHLYSKSVLLVVPPGETLSKFDNYFDIRRAKAVSGSEPHLFVIE